MPNSRVILKQKASRNQLIRTCKSLHAKNQKLTGLTNIVAGALFNSDKEHPFFVKGSGLFTDPQIEGLKKFAKSPLYKDSLKKIEDQIEENKEKEKEKLENQKKDKRINE